MDKIPAVLGKAAELRKVSLRQLGSGRRRVRQDRQAAAAGPQAPRRFAADPLRAGLSRSERHRAGWARRRLESRTPPRQHGRRHHRSAGAAAGQPVGGAADGQAGGPRRHHLLDRSRHGASRPGLSRSTAHLPVGSDPQAVAARAQSRPSAWRRSSSTACRRPATSPASWWPPITT